MKNKILVTLLCHYTISCCAVSAALANEQFANHTYILFEGGVSNPANSLDKYPGNHHLKSTNVMGLGAGYYMNDNFRMDLVINYRPDFRYKAEEVTNDGLDSEISQKITSQGFMVSAYYNIGSAYNIFKPYLGAGIGFAKNNARNLYETDANEKITYYGTSKCNVTWQVALGTLIKINDTLDMNLNYRYVDLGSFTTKGKYHSSINQKDAKIKPLKGKLTSNEFILGVNLNL